MVGSNYVSETLLTVQGSWTILLSYMTPQSIHLGKSLGNRFKSKQGARKQGGEVRCRESRNNCSLGYWLDFHVISTATAKMALYIFFNDEFKIPERDQI